MGLEEALDLSSDRLLMMMMMMMMYCLVQNALSTQHSTTKGQILIGTINAYLQCHRELPYRQITQYGLTL